MACLSLLPYFPTSQASRVFFLPTIRLSAPNPSQRTERTATDPRSASLTRSSCDMHAHTKRGSQPSVFLEPHVCAAYRIASMHPSFLPDFVALAPAAEPSQIGGTVYPSAQARSPLLPSHARHPHAICVHGPCSPASSNHHHHSLKAQAQAIDFSSCSRKERKEEKCIISTHSKAQNANTKPTSSHFGL